MACWYASVMADQNPCNTRRLQGCMLVRARALKCCTFPTLMVEKMFLAKSKYTQGQECVTDPPFSPEMVLIIISSYSLANQAVADPEGVQGVQANPPWRPNYFNFMGSFKKNYAKSTKRPPLCKFEPPLQKSWIRH